MDPRSESPGLDCSRMPAALWRDVAEVVGSEPEMSPTLSRGPLRIADRWFATYNAYIARPVVCPIARHPVRLTAPATPVRAPATPVRATKKQATPSLTPSI